MNTPKRKALMAALLLVVGAGAFGAQAADTQVAAATVQSENLQSGASSVNYTAAPTRDTSARRASQFLAFEKELEANSAPSLTTADRHNDVRRHSTSYLPSPFPASEPG
jgi:hypothetical protein